MLQHTITAFKEYKHFKTNKPWSVVKMTFPNGGSTPPHYGETIEILLCDGIKGECHIGGQHFNFNGKQVFFIAPNIIHSMTYLPNNGTVYVIKLYLSGLSRYFNLQAVFDNYELNISDLPICSPCIKETENSSKLLSSEKTDILTAINELSKLFSAYIKAIPFENKTHLPVKENDQICEIIKWTETNYAEKYTIDDIASKIGYTKNYFCNKFKSVTGITYIEYLTHVRILHSCEYLKKNTEMSISDISEKCGFFTTSYFISKFKRIVGMSPGKYRKMLHTDNQN